MTVRLLIEPALLQAGPMQLHGDEHHYLSKVRRLAVGAQVTLLDGQGCRAQARIVSITAKQSELQVDAPETLPPPAFSLTVAPSLIKGERMDLIVTKLVELGVTRILPITTERTVVRPTGERAKLRHKRFESLAKAASRQSQNPHLPKIAPIQALGELLAHPGEHELRLIPHLGADAHPLQDALPDAQIGSALVLIGPEGGFADQEIRDAVASGFVPVGLGERTLRAETACLAMASILAFRYGDVGRR